MISKKDIINFFGLMILASGGTMLQSSIVPVRATAHKISSHIGRHFSAPKVIEPSFYQRFLAKSKSYIPTIKKPTMPKVNYKYLLAPAFISGPAFTSYLEYEKLELLQNKLELLKQESLCGLKFVEDNFNESPFDHKIPIVLNFYKTWLEKLTKSEVEEEYRDKIDDYINQEQDNFDSAWSSKLYLSKKKLHQRDVDKFDLDAKISDLHDKLDTTDTKDLSDIINELMTIKKELLSNYSKKEDSWNLW